MGFALMNPKPLNTAGDANAETVIVLENDLYRRAPADVIDSLFQGRKIIALDYLTNRTTEQAALVLPASTFAEGDGTFVNNEGRAQRFFQVFKPVQPIQDSWRWLGSLPGSRWTR